MWTRIEKKIKRCVATFNDSYLRNQQLSWRLKKNLFANKLHWDTQLFHFSFIIEIPQQSGIFVWTICLSLFWYTPNAVTQKIPNIYPSIFLCGTAVLTSFVRRMNERRKKVLDERIDESDWEFRFFNSMENKSITKFMNSQTQINREKKIVALIIVSLHGEQEWLLIKLII